jgi:hypothetical protein
MCDIKRAFEKLCESPVESQTFYVSLYARVPYYGGPEEGGWWGEDWHLVSYQQVSSEVGARELQDRIVELADELSTQSRREHDQQCRRECEWLDARGLESDSLPEVDGATEYFVRVERTPGAAEKQGTRHYE